MRSWALLPTVFFVGCAVGITPPEDTPMVLIDEGLIFQFGSEAPCSNTAPETNVCTEDDPYPSLNLANVHPRAWVELAPFYIDQHEVTNIQYEFCEAMGACPRHNIVNAVAASQARYHLTDEFDRFPVVQVTFEQAEAYCEFVGKRLPTEFEWERVARGNRDAGQDRVFPAEGLDGNDGGGNLLDCKPKELPTEYCKNRELEAVPTEAVLTGGGIGPADHVIDRRNDGEESQPIYHMFGNAAEWTSSFYSKAITCEPDASSGCKPCWECDDSDDACLDECRSCDDCSDGTCGFLCEGPAANTTFACVTRSSSQEAPLKPEKITPTTAAKRVIRGGSVFDGTSRACLMRSGARDRVDSSNSLTPDRPQPYVGFRCVMDAE